MIGENISHLVRTARELCHYNIAGIDLNMGCPAPRVYRKHVGGGLLREREKVDPILGELRAAIHARPLTVKMRIGFDNTDTFHEILDIVARHSIDLLSLDGRTVKDMYRGEVRYDLIAEAVNRLDCPVLANGNIRSAKAALEVLAQTGAAGIMVGRWAIANPWIFKQIRRALQEKMVNPEGIVESITRVPLLEVRNYTVRLWQNPNLANMPARARIGYLKRLLNYIALLVDAEGHFLRLMRKTQTEVELFQVCDCFLLAKDGKNLALASYSDIQYK